MSETHEGYFLIADITGYTRYLSESELEHAQDTLTALLQLLVENTRPPLVISRLAGDAVISYGLRESFFQGQTLIEKIEDTYVAFRKAIERLVLNNTCRCNACANISNLDLKFFIHYGTFGIQRISDHDELVGSDINLLHRLLKNSVTEKTGVRAYALFSEAAIQQLGVEDLVDGMTPHTETYEYLGEVEVWVQDMQPVWGKKRSAATVTFPTGRIWWRYEVDISLPRELAWDYLIQPEFRNTLIGSDRMEITNRANGRIAPGSVYQCYHGDKPVPQTILEWQPFESMIVKELFPISQVIDRPVAKVFHFVAHEHVRNHPRWDPEIELEQVSDGPIGVGTVIRRRNSRSGTPVEGTMEVVEFEPNRAMATVIHDGPVEMRGRVTFEAVSDNQTNITFNVELPGMDESMDKSFLTSRLERSVRNIKQLIESEG